MIRRTSPWQLSSPILLALFFLLGPTLGDARVAEGGGFRVSFSGSFSPRRLPRERPSPVTLRLRARVTPIPGRRPPRLLRLRVALNRHAVISTRGLPVCPVHRLLSLSTAEALRACPRSLVGSGHFGAHIDIPEQSPFPASGRLLVFNSRLHGHAALIGHVFGTRPTRTVEALPILLYREGRRGAIRPAFSVQMPEVGDEWGYVTGLDLTFGRTYRYQHRLHSFLSASCPAPPDIAHVPFIAAGATYYLAGGRVVHRLLSQTCTPAAG